MHSGCEHFYLSYVRYVGIFLPQEVPILNENVNPNCIFVRVMYINSKKR